MKTCHCWLIFININIASAFQGAACLRRREYEGGKTVKRSSNLPTAGTLSKKIIKGITRYQDIILGKKKKTQNNEMTATKTSVRPAQRVLY